MRLILRRLHCAFFVMLFFCSLPLNGQQSGSPRNIVSLDGPGWKLVGLEPGSGEKLGINLGLSAKAGFIPTSVPNDVQRVIGLKDPLGQGSEVWDVNKREWWYVRAFASPEVQATQQVRLVFDGVDYFADVWFNGEKLGDHEGAFTHFDFDITKKLRTKGENYLAVRVTSPLTIPGRSRNELMKGEFVDGRGWDALPGTGEFVYPLGLHRSVRLEITAAARFEELQVVTTGLRRQDADLRLKVTVSNSGPLREGTLRVTIKPKNSAGPALDLPPRPIAFAGRAGESQEIELAAQVEQAKLWWTWDQGPQNLYTAEATLADNRGALIDRLSVTFGIRTLERDSNMLYRLNGRPVFLRGAWEPMITLYPGDASRWVYEKDLRLARHAHMNHLLGYTIIERDEFYDLADELGILLFVELPFNQWGPHDAVHKDYARRDEYLRWCSGEVGKIMRSLANHPSVGVWSGLAETTGSAGDFASRDDVIGQAADGYEMFTKIIEELVKQKDPDALYFRSFCDFGERHYWDGAFISGSTYDGHFDAHTGFVSEYGTHALFPLEDLRRVVNPEELWGQGTGQYSSLALPFNIKKMSYLNGWQYRGLDFLTSSIAANVDRNIRSFQDYVSDSQVYQAFLYGYAADAYRRKLFDPINGARSWCYKTFAEKPISGFGVIDAFDTPTKGYYAQRRTFAPVSMSYAVRYALESVPAGGAWKVPVWISNATNEPLSLAVESVLYDLKGKRLQESQADTSVPARQAREVANLDWRLPEVPGIYLLRSHARRGTNEIAGAAMYVKVVPKVTPKTLRVLVLGTPQWAQPVADYVANLGASVTRVVYQPVEWGLPSLVESPFPASMDELRRNYDVIWLAGFDAYWREAPDEGTRAIVQAVESGMTLIHTGSWSSFHGGGGTAAALDLTPLAQLLPVEVEAENDVLPRTSYRTGNELNAPPDSWPGVVTASETAPRWLRDVDFTGLAPSAGYHILNARPGAEVLLRLALQPLLVSGHYGKGLTLAYLGFSPEDGRSVRKRQPLIVDRAIRASAEGRLFTIITAALLALASGAEPAARLGDLVQARLTPLYETLKNHPAAPLPDVSLSWERSDGKGVRARIHIRNGAEYLYGLRLRFDGPDFRDGKALPLWSDQYFDLIPGDELNATVEIFTADGSPLRDISLLAETLYGKESKVYPISAPPR